MLVGNTPPDPYRYTLPAAVNGEFTNGEEKNPPSPAYRPCGARYDATYVVPAVTATGDANVTVCHPDDVSPLNVAVASNEPADDHKLPVCVPPFDAPPL